MARILGLDISPKAVRGTLVRTALRRIELQGYCSAPIAEATDPQGRAEALREAIRSVLAECGKPPDRVIAELDGREASLRVVEIPAGAAKRVGEVLPFELESMLPFAVEDAVVDHQPIATEEGQFRLLAAAAPKEHVATRLAELRDAGIEPRELAIGAAALDGLLPLLPLLQEEGPFLLLDVEQDETEVCVLHRGHCTLARTLSEGIADLAGGELEGALRRTLASFRASGAPAPVRAYLMGDAAADPNAVGWIQEKLEIETAVVPLPQGPGADPELLGTFGRATALACRSSGRGKRIDMRQGEFASKQTMGAVRQHAKLIAVCSAVVLVSFVFSVWARWTILDDERDALQGQLASVTEEAFGVAVESPMQARELLERGPRTNDPLPEFDAFDALDAVSGAIPQEITHDTSRFRIELDEDGRAGRFELQGRLASVAERDDVAEALGEHDCFHEIEKGRTTPGPGNEGLNYQIEAVVRCGEPPEEDEEDGRRRRRNRED